MPRRALVSSLTTPTSRETGVSKTYSSNMDGATISAWPSQAHGQNRIRRVARRVLSNTKKASAGRIERQQSRIRVSGNRHERGENNSNQFFHHPKQCGLRLLTFMSYLPCRCCSILIFHLGWCASVVVVTYTGGCLLSSQIGSIMLLLGSVNSTPFPWETQGLQESTQLAAMLPTPFLSRDSFSHPTLLPASTHHPRCPVV